MRTKKKIVIVVPCYNEEESLPFMIESTVKLKYELDTNYQLDLLLINDGSSDQTQSLIEEYSKKNDFIYFREFSHNAGHQSALRAGINASIHYDATIMMDADMQHPPELIPDMLKKWQNGAEIVQMIRKESANEVGPLKFFVRNTYYKALNFISDLELEYGASDFRLIDQAVAATVANSPERDLFLRGYFSWLPVKRVAIEYKPSKRIAGSSKYTLKKLLGLAYQSVLQFSEKPLKIAVSIGMVIALLSFFYGVVLVIQRLTGTRTVSGWTSMMVIMLFCFGLNFILFGIIGRYLAHSIRIQKKRPEFVVAKEKLPFGFGLSKK